MLLMRDVKSDSCFEQMKSCGTRTLDEVPSTATPLSELTALVVLIRCACGIDGKLSPFANTVHRN